MRQPRRKGRSVNGILQPARLDFYVSTYGEFAPEKIGTNRKVKIPRYSRAAVTYRNFQFYFRSGFRIALYNKRTAQKFCTHFHSAHAEVILRI